jgi:hypothetical protein
VLLAPGLVAVAAACSTFHDANPAPGSEGGPEAGAEGGPETGAACGSDPTCTTEIIATNEHGPWGITVDSDSVYFTNRVASGSVAQCPKTGCGAKRIELASGQGHPYGIAVSGNNVYWTSTDDGAIRTALKGAAGFAAGIYLDGTDGGATRSPTALLANTDNLVWIDTNFGGDTRGGIIECPIAGCTNPHAINIFQSGAVGLTFSTPDVFWTAGGSAGYVATCPNCTYNMDPPKLGGAIPSPAGLSADSDALYVATESEPGGVLKIEKAGGTAKPLISGQNRPFGIVVDDTYVFFTTRGTDGAADGTVTRMSKLDGSNPTPIATGLRSPAWIVADLDYVYWTNEADGTVMRARKEH